MLLGKLWAGKVVFKTYEFREKFVKGMSLEKRFEVGKLLEFYGALLSEKQRGVMEQYYFNDLSLSEIALLLSSTRQAVRDIIVRAESNLADIEQKLGLVKDNALLKQKLQKCLELLSAGEIDTCKALLSEIGNL
ncbi:MAG: hypothetical protein FWB72_06395 [Firmicutes bacterium]|nr:hypothetical protein [Bacillota bacterium]